MMRHTSTTLALVAPAAGMFDAWYASFERYAASAGAKADRRSAGTLWRWLLDGTYRVAGVLAVDTRKDVVGFAHYHPFPHTLNGTEACSLDDLYVADDYRDDGLTERLLDHVCGIARKRGWSEVRWFAGVDDPRAATFEHVAQRSPLTAYRIVL